MNIRSLGIILSLFMYTFHTISEQDLKKFKNLLGNVFEKSLQNAYKDA